MISLTEAILPTMWNVESSFSCFIRATNASFTVNYKKSVKKYQNLRNTALKIENISFHFHRTNIITEIFLKMKRIETK